MPAQGSTVPAALLSGLAACAAASVLLVGCRARSPVPTETHATTAVYPVSVIPAPNRVMAGNGSVVIRAGVRITTSREPQSARVARYFADLMRRTRGLDLEVVEREAATADSGIVFRLEPGSGSHEQPLDGPSAESYELEISTKRVVVSARDPRGLFYGAVTLWQLCTEDVAVSAARSGAGRAGATTVDASTAAAAPRVRATAANPEVPAPAGAAIKLPALRIVDRPRFPWRGVMLDSARHYQSPEFILQFIDWMALHKLNVLHWHLTDDQGWRLEIKKYPRLTSVGAWRVPAGAAAGADIDPGTGQPRLYGGYYSQDVVRRIVAHAAERNITIVPELDMPGHATAAIVAYPWLAAADHPPRAVPSDWGIFDNLYNVDEQTFGFLQDVLDEVMTLFPGEYIHIGGDEAVKTQWKASPKVQARMRELGVADEEKLQSYFIARIERYLNAHGRRLIGWDEILQGGIAPNASVMSWRGIDGAIAAAAAGHDTVLTPWPTLYFDNRQGAGPTEPPGRGRVITLEDVYRFDPAPAAITAEQRHHVLGLQGNVWTEHIRTEDRVGYMTFPRAAAVAEAGWTAPEGRDWKGFLARLPAEFGRYRSLEVPHSEDPLSPEGPVQPLRPFERHMSQSLKTCTDQLTLSLEDDAPLHGPRAVFLSDIMNPCWIFPSADLSRGPALRAAVGQVPFNFQIGEDVKKIHFEAPRSASGELNVRLDGCDGEIMASLALDPALANDAVTVLPDVRLPARGGRHDLCLKFTQRTIDPMWAIDWVQVLE